MQKTILYLGINNWNYIKQRPQYLAEELSRNNKILYVNPCESLLHWVSLLSRKKRSFRSSLWKVSPNLMVFTAPPFFLSRKMYDVNCLAYSYNLFLGLRLRKVMRILGWDRVEVMWLSYPNQLFLTNLIPHKKLCYDIMDDYPYLRKIKFLKHQLDVMHRKLIDRADLIFVSSTELYKKLKNKKNIYVIKNAVDMTLFNPFLKYDIPSELENLSRPLVGVVGYVGHWIDLEIIYRSAKIHPKWSFIVIGPIHRNINKYKADNLYFLGEKKHSELPKYISFFDVCIIPFIKNELTHKVNPIKMFEYLAMNKAVLAAQTEELKRYQDYCYLYSGFKEFESYLNKLIKNPSVKKICNSFLENNSWKKRGKTISTIISKYAK